MEGDILRQDTLMRIRQDLEENIGRGVILEADMGRRRIVTKEGIIEATYPHLFVAEVNNEFGNKMKVSYTYSDVLTGTVKVTLKKED